jgi:hypothetical protein
VRFSPGCACCPSASGPTCSTCTWPATNMHLTMVFVSGSNNCLDGVSVPLTWNGTYWDNFAAPVTGLCGGNYQAVVSVRCYTDPLGGTTYLGVGVNIQRVSPIQDCYGILFNNNGVNPNAVDCTAYTAAWNGRTFIDASPPCGIGLNTSTYNFLFAP